MLIDKSEIISSFNRIKENALEQHPAASVLVFVALEVDALCASRVLLQLLREDFVTYELVPVVGYDDIATASLDLLKGDTIRSIVFINCGGTLDLADFLLDHGIDLDAHPELSLYVFDSLRPLHLANVHNENQVYVFVDTKTEPSVPSREDLLIAQADVDLSDTDEESENEAERQTERQTEGQTESETEKESVSAFDHDGDLDSPSAKRRRIETDKQHTRQQRLSQQRQSQETVMNYYSKGNAYGTASALLLYDLVEALAKYSNDLLWPAILGLTDQYLHEKIEQDVYTNHIAELKDKVALINRDQAEVTVLHGEVDLNSLSDEGNTIAFHDELRLMALRHWSLYDSMVYSPYVATRLKTWTDGGKYRLHMLLTKMGLPLRQCKESFTVMKPELKKGLRAKLEEHAAESDLNVDEMLYGTFCRKYPFQTPLSASDAVYALTALLESPRAQDNGTANEEAVDERKILRNNFFLAWDALGGKDWARLMQRGLTLSIEQQQALVLQAKSIIDERQVVAVRGFRHCKTLSDYAVFGTPLVLTRLAFFLYDIYKERRSGPMPFVVASPKQTQTMLVVGVMGTRQYGHLHKNTFGMAFRRAAERIKAEFRHDSFAANVIELRTADYSHFLGSLSHLFN